MMPERSLELKLLQQSPGDDEGGDHRGNFFKTLVMLITVVIVFGVRHPRSFTQLLKREGFTEGELLDGIRAIIRHLVDH